MVASSSGSSTIFRKPHRADLLCHKKNARRPDRNNPGEKRSISTKRWIPPISWNVGGKHEHGTDGQGYRGYQTEDGSYYSNNDYPNISTSISIPIYNPDKEAERDRGGRAFLSVMPRQNTEYWASSVQIFQVPGRRSEFWVRAENFNLRALGTCMKSRQPY